MAACLRPPGELIWDDSFLVHDNPFIKSPFLILEAFRHHLMLDSLSAHYRPVQNISYMFDYLVWNTNTYGFHLSNILWHVASGVLLYLLLNQPSGSVGALPACQKAAGGQQRTGDASLVHCVAFLLAFLWVVHPVHSAAIDATSPVAPIAWRFLLFCGVVTVSARSRSRWNRCQNPSRLGGRFFAPARPLLARKRLHVGADLSHPPFPFRKNHRPAKQGCDLRLCLGVVGVCAGLRQLPNDRPAAVRPTNGRPRCEGVLMLRALGDYGRLMIFPANLRMERTVVNPDGARSNADWRRTVANEYLAILGLLVAAGLVVGAWRKGPAADSCVFGATWFLLTYLPISNVIELNATVAEHWLYLPSVGFLVFLARVAALSFLCASDNSPPRWHAWRSLASARAATCAAPIG